MSAIAASSVKVSTLVDGTLRLVVDIEPAHATDAFALFGKPGTPLGIAALKTEPQQRQSEARERTRLGPIAQWLVERCKEPAFQLWIVETQTGTNGEQASERVAAAWCKWRCGVESRKDIDGNPAAEALFQRFVRGPWVAHNGGRS